MKFSKPPIIKSKFSKQPPLSLVAIIAIAGFLLVVTGMATSVANQSLEPRKQALVDQIISQQRDVDDLDKAVAELRSQVNQARTVAGRASSEKESENQRQEEFAVLAGTLEMKGDGIVVKLSDAERKPGDDDHSFDAHRIQDSDIQLIVNALFESGAEAVAINDNRVVAVTPIRAAGGTIVVNYRPVSSPYRIAAIGADKGRFEDSEIAGHFEQWKKKFQLGYEVNKSNKLSVPAYAGRVGIDVAVPAESVPTVSPTSGLSSGSNSGTTLKGGN